MIKLIFKWIALAIALSFSDVEFSAGLRRHGVDAIDVMPIMDAVTDGNLSEVDAYRVPSSPRTCVARLPVN